MAVAQARQQVFSDVRHFFQFAEAQESAGAFDGMNRAEHSRQRIPILRIFFQANRSRSRRSRFSLLSTRKSWTISLSLIAAGPFEGRSGTQ
jgi:hypothetical protein